MPRGRRTPRSNAPGERGSRPTVLVSPRSHLRLLECHSCAPRRVVGGATGNSRLTAQTALVLLVVLAIEGATLLSLQTFLSWHIVVGMLLVPIVGLKVASTGYWPQSGLVSRSCWACTRQVSRCGSRRCPCTCSVTFRGCEGSPPASFVATRAEPPCGPASSRQSSSPVRSWPSQRFRSSTPGFTGCISLVPTSRMG